MIFRLGPITIMDSKTRASYAKLANVAYQLHQAIWYTDDLCIENSQKVIKLLDAQVSEALSYTPPEDIQSSE
jgi:hypothetical protein